MKILIIVLMTLLGSNSFAQFINVSSQQGALLNSSAGRNIVKYNPDHADLGIAGFKGLGLDGYDPVSFFSDHGPTKGDVKNQIKYQGVIYNFSSAENMEIFLANPNKYEPTYGGWCAWAMVFGSPVPIDVRFYSFDLDSKGQPVRINFFVNAAAMGNFHGFGRRDRKTSLEIFEDMKNGVLSVLQNAKDNQAKADANWLLPEFGDEEPRLSNGLN